MNEQEMKNEVDAILVDNVSQRNRIQTLLKEMAIHTNQHGNVTPFVYLADRLGSDDAKGLNIRAIGDWINAFTKCNIQYDAKTKKHVASYVHTKTTVLSGTGYKNWYEFKPSTLSDEYSLEDVLKSAVSLANKKMREKARLEKAGNFEAAAKIKVDHTLVKKLRLVVDNPASIILPDEQTDEDTAEVIPSTAVTA